MVDYKLFPEVPLVISGHESSSYPFQMIFNLKILWHAYEEGLFVPFEK
jgi:hypothetical protein